ncbi:MAG: molybdate ABC transporter substrate-binding protein, partial [Ilumatobacteraceae bacterium]
AYTASHPDTEVTFNFAGSSELVAQILEGAPADVYVSADVANMDRLTDAEATDGDPVIFATNRSEIIVAPENPVSISDVADLAADDLIVVTCAPEVPCGSYATQIFVNAGVPVTPDSYERNVKSVVTKVTLGEADAGIVYRTDVVAAGKDAEGVEIPDAINVVAQYPIAVTAESSATESAGDFVDFVQGDDGQAILASFGFGPP